MCRAYQGRLEDSPRNSRGQVVVSRMSSLIRSVPFRFDLLLSLGRLPERSRRRALCGAFRAKRRRTPQRVLTPAIDSTAATSFSAHSLAARDDPAQAYFLCSWLSHGPAYLALPALPEVAPLDLRSPCIRRDSALLPPHLPTHRPVLWLSLAHSACSEAGVAENAPVRHHSIVADRSFHLQSENLPPLRCARRPNVSPCTCARGCASSR